MFKLFELWMIAVIFNGHYSTFTIFPLNSMFKDVFFLKKTKIKIFFWCRSWSLGRHDISHYGTIRQTKEGMEHRKLLKPNKQIIVIPIISLWLTIE